MALSIYTDKVSATDDEPLGIGFEVRSVSSVELYEDDELMGTYPKHFAEMESADIISAELIEQNVGSSSLEVFELTVRYVVQRLKLERVLGAVN
jgi:hypothetical protein